MELAHQVTGPLRPSGEDPAGGLLPKRGTAGVRLWRPRAATKEAKTASVAAELGPFARGRIAVERFAQTFDYQPSVNGGAAQVIRRSPDTLAALLDRGEDLFCVTVDQGASLRDAVAARPAGLGRAFGVARVARDA